jgi:hypothetical protein
MINDVKRFSPVLRAKTVFFIFYNFTDIADFQEFFELNALTIFFV